MTGNIYGAAGPTPFAKSLIAFEMCRKGLLFYDAGISLRSKHGGNSVASHLICQSFEIVAKGILLLKDYDHYRPRLTSRKGHKLPSSDIFGHDLMKLYNELAYVGLIVSPYDQLQEELRRINPIYTKHLYRYSSSLDILNDFDQIETVEMEKYILHIYELIMVSGASNLGLLQPRTKLQ